MKSFTIFLLTLFLSLEVSAFSFQPPADRTGAPPGGMTCASCHTGLGAGSLSLNFGNDSLTYVPGQSYSLQVMLQDLGQKRFGFSMTAREASSPTNSVGTWTAGINSGVYDSGRHIAHMNAPFADDRFTFEVTWTAPPEDIGPIRFYAAGNAANGNFSNGPGDNIYTQQLTIHPAAPSVSFWNLSPVENGWRNTGSGYPELRGIGWIFDAPWPWYYTFAHQGDGGGEWVYVFTSLSSQSGFWGYNFDGDYYFWGAPTIGWYYSYKPGEEGWVEYKF